MTSDYVTNIFFIWKDCLIKCFSRELTAEISEKFHTGKSHTMFHMKVLRDTDTYTHHGKLEPVPCYLWFCHTPSLFL